MGDLDPSNTWFLGPCTQVHNPNGILIGSAVFAGLTSVTDKPTDRPTDHTTRSVTIGRIYERSTAMRTKNIDRKKKIDKFLTVGTLKRAELRRRAKFGRNRSKRGRDMAIFRFFKMAAAAILIFTARAMLALQALY